MVRLLFTPFSHYHRHLQACSCKRTGRRLGHRFTHEWADIASCATKSTVLTILYSRESVFDRLDLVLHWLCPFRGEYHNGTAFENIAEYTKIPCNIVLKLTSPKLWLPTLTLAWGVVATLLGVTKNMGGFFAARFILGMTESGLFPGVVFYLSMWYKREERQYRISLFFSAASLAGAFGGILAWVSYASCAFKNTNSYNLGHRPYEWCRRVPRMALDLHS